MNVVLLSGGMDSATALYLNRGHEAWLYDYGQRHREQELAAAEDIASMLGSPTRTLSLPAPNREGLLHRGRNALMASAACAAGASRIVFGFCRDDYAGFPDCRPEFLGPLAAAFRKGYEVEIEAPLIGRSKRDFVRDYWDDPLYRAVVSRSYSCYAGEATACGECSACKLRNAALHGLPG